MRGCLCQVLFQSSFQPLQLVGPSYLAESKNLGYFSSSLNYHCTLPNVKGFQSQKKVSFKTAVDFSIPTSNNYYLYHNLGKPKLWAKAFLSFSIFSSRALLSADGIGQVQTSESLARFNLAMPLVCRHTNQN